MKKEKWLLKEIEGWQASEIIDDATADTLKGMYQPKKSISLLMVLFSVIGSVLIGMGIVLVSANNWWYSLPIGIRAFIGFLPLLISQGVVFFTYKFKMNSTAFRESSALLNMAGVFASIALVGQIFHIPGDFTNYLLVCGLLFLPTMLIMNAISPLIVYYWTAINGGICFSEELGIVISVLMFAVGAIFALKKCKDKNGKSIYLSWVTAVSAFVLVFVSALNGDGDWLIIKLFGFSLLLMSASPWLRGSEDVFTIVGKLCFIISGFIITYHGAWGYIDKTDGITSLVFAVLVIVAAVIFFIKNIKAKNYCLFSIANLALLILRTVWYIFELTDSPFDVIFMIVSNAILFAISVLCIFDGAKKIDLYNANTGMVILCTLVVMRFFDSELPLAARGVAFLILGAGFLLFNLYLVKTKKKIKEETI